MPLLFTVIKYVHILAAIVAVGFNISYAIWITRAQNDSAHLDFALRGVKFLDDYIANPAYILLLLSGLGMVYVAGYRLTQFWLWGALVLWGVAMIMGYGFYTPTLRQQIKTLAASGAASAEYRRVSNRGTALGITLGVIVALILALMVFKPTL
ncbi:MAG TPA: DUF2269 family protein [Ktedonobacterales bacterium]